MARRKLLIPPYDEMRERFQLNLRHLIQTHKLSYSKTAELIGSKKGKVTHMCQGFFLPSTRVLLNICRVFEVTPDQLLGLKPTGTDPALRKAVRQAIDDIEEVL